MRHEAGQLADKDSLFRGTNLRRTGVACAIFFCGSTADPIEGLDKADLYSPTMDRYAIRRKSCHFYYPTQIAADPFR